MDASAKRLLEPTKYLADHEDDVVGSADLAVVLLPIFIARSMVTIVAYFEHMKLSKSDSRDKSDCVRPSLTWVLIFADGFIEPRVVAASDESAPSTDLVVVAQVGFGEALEVASVLETLVE